MGFDLITFVPLLLPHCSFFFVFGHGVCFSGGFQHLLSMVIQQLVVILVLSQEEMSTCPSTLLSWTRSPLISTFLCNYSLFAWCMSICFLFFIVLQSAIWNYDLLENIEYFNKGKTACMIGNFGWLYWYMTTLHRQNFFEECDWMMGGLCEEKKKHKKSLMERAV